MELMNEVQVLAMFNIHGIIRSYIFLNIIVLYCMKGQ